MITRILLICGCFILTLHVLPASGQQTSGQPRLINRTRLRSATHVGDREKLLQPHELIEEQTENKIDNAAMQMLHKINDRLTAMSTVNDQQLRRLETFEYRITKLEVQIQEKTDSLRSDLKEVSRRVQQLDWQSSKTESALDSLKSDTTFLKQAVEHFRVAPALGTSVESSKSGLDVSAKLLSVLRGVQSLLNGLSSLQGDMHALRRNVTKISNSSSYFELQFPQLLTTKHFQSSLQDLQRFSYQPICSSSNIQTSSYSLPSDPLPRDCSEVPGNKSGVFRIKPPSSQTPFFVFCDLGWTVIQRRSEGTLDFYKGWHDYKHGFGNIGGEFWLGLEKIHALTNDKVNEIYIELEDFSLEKTHAHYAAFGVGNEVEGYPISFLGDYDGTAGDSLLYHAGQKFSTFDMDHDNWAEGNCALSHNGAWWYNGCDTSNLNGRYLNGELPDQYEYQGMYWYEWRGSKYSLKQSKIMVRPVQDKSDEANNNNSSNIEEDDVNKK